LRENPGACLTNAGRGPCDQNRLLFHSLVKR
jgi:hypothetical protein